MHVHHFKVRAWLSAAALVIAGATTPAQAAELIFNGGFESGFANWTRVDQLGGDGTFGIQSGTSSWLNVLPVEAPPQGTYAAMTDAGGPGSHVLYQDFVVSSLGSGALLSFQLFISNNAPEFSTPASLDFALTSQIGAQTLNQQFRVDIMTTTADVFSVAPGDILQSIYQTQPTDALVSGYTTISTDLTALLAANLGQTLRLRFAQADNVDIMNVGIDGVSLETSDVPEPTTGMLFGVAAMGLVARLRRRLRAVAPVACVAALAGAQAIHLRADSVPPQILDPNLQVTPVLASGLVQPIGIVFLGQDDFLLLEKASGQVKRVIGGVIQPVPVLDLAVNSNSERGLLSLVLAPGFPTNPSVYIRWTESLSGVDSTAVADVPLLGNRVDRFTWDGSSLTLAENVVRLRARQTDNVVVPGKSATSANANEQGNHNGGVMRFGPDGKLYVFMGDQGRRGWMQNLTNGPFLTTPFVDDTFGGPSPDNAHLSGVILRLNTDGSAPADNPFFAAGASIGGEVGQNLQKVFSYGHRNGFGMAFDPYSGALWESENADDAYSEINRVAPGMNGGWIQFAGPSSRFPDFKYVETNQFNKSLQQVRYPPTRLAYTTAASASRLFMLPGAAYADPDFSWRYEVGPSAMAFVQGVTLGAEYDGTMWMGSSRSFQQVGANGGSLYRFRMTSDRAHVDVSADPRLADRVADNLFRAQKFEGTESETLVIGRYFGTVADIKQGPDGNLYVVSLTDNAVYKISRRPA